MKIKLELGLIFGIIIRFKKKRIRPRTQFSIPFMRGTIIRTKIKFFEEKTKIKD